MFFKCSTAVLRSGRRFFVLCALCAAVVQSGIAQKVNVNFDGKFDFSQVHRYQWRTHPIFEKHPELRDRYSTAIQLVMGATNEQLMKKGYQSVGHNPDVFLTFFVTARDVTNTYTDMLGPSGAWYGWYGWYMPPVWTVTRTEQYLEGTLLMDMVNPKDTQLVWRASATDSVKDFRNRDKNVDAAVKKIFKKFPPKQKS
ncbi:MAG TPA: DUF4136 domain-containing protein [Bryobacteraceae bacterium]